MKPVTTGGSSGTPLLTPQTAMGIKQRFVCHGYLTLSNHGGMKIQLSEDGEAARLCYYERVSHWQKVKNNTIGSYVTYYGQVYYLHEFIRVRFERQQNLKVV